MLLKITSRVNHLGAIIADLSVSVRLLHTYEVLPDGTVNTRSLPDARELEEEAAEAV